MNDTLQYGVLAIGLLLVLHVGLMKSVERRAYEEVHNEFGAHSTVRVTMVPSGIFGLEANHWRNIIIGVHDAHLSDLPLYLHPHSSWRGEIDRLTLKMSNLDLSGIAVDRLTAEIPRVTYDAADAVFRGRLQLRSAHSGPARIWVGDTGLEEFIARKYSRILRSVAVRISNGRVFLTAQLNLLGTWMPIDGQFHLREIGGRYVYLTQPVVVLNHQPATPGLSAAVAKQVNPVLDTVTDLGLQGVFRMSSVAIHGIDVQFLGTMQLPIALNSDAGKKDK